MVASKELTYKLLPEWSITQRDTSLIISGGADARYEIELETSKPSFFSGLKPEVPFTRSELTERDVRVLEELITAEIIVPVLGKGKILRIGSLGDVKRLGLAFHKNNKTADFLLIVRGTSTYAELLDQIDYQSITKPHLFVDMAFHHTLSLGPLVFPGETACIACLQGRIATRWGDEKPPMTPQMTSKYAGVVSELIKTELGRIYDGETGLTNKTISWNFQDRTTKISQLLKVPLCPICSQNRIDRSGALALPWSKDESTTNSV